MNSYVCILFYDIPTTVENLKLYRQLRKKLLYNGFYQIQESVYAYKHQDKNTCYRILDNVKSFDFKEANVKAIIVTQSVFDKMILIHGEKTITDVMLDNKTFIVEL